MKIEQSLIIVQTEYPQLVVIYKVKDAVDCVTRYLSIINRDGTKDTKRGKFQVAGCLNVITLSQHAS